MGSLIDRVRYAKGKVKTLVGSISGEFKLDPPVKEEKTERPRQEATQKTEKEQEKERERARQEALKAKEKEKEPKIRQTVEDILSHSSVRGAEPDTHGLPVLVLPRGEKFLYYGYQTGEYVRQYVKQKVEESYQEK